MYHQEISLMRRSCAIHGCTLPELKALLESPGDKADAIAQTYANLKSMVFAKNAESSKGRLKPLIVKLSPYEEFIAASKNPDSMRNTPWVKKIFQRGKATQAECVALLSNSSASFMRPFDPYQVEKSHLTSDSLTRSAERFCKRFNLL